MADVKNNQAIGKIAATAATLAVGIVSSLTDQVTAAEQENGVAESAPLPDYMVKTPRVNSKLILQNMEEVLNSVKKKHRAKHKRKRELKKLALMEAAAAKELLVHCKKPLQAAQQNHGTNSILNHFVRTPKKRASVADSTADDVSVDLEPINVDEETATLTPSVPSKTPNAFELMMNARNKSIGGNTPGKECMQDEQCTSTPTHVKRKLLLQDWAERKGGAKRKLEEEARAIYVEQQLDQRAKRLKNLLSNGSATPNSERDADSKTHRKTRRLRRLSSTSSLPAGNKESVPPEAAESVVPKSDSLLGYFQRKTETPKAKPKVRSGRQRAQLETIDTPETEIISASTEVEELPTSSGRPKRTCTSKKRYDYDISQEVGVRATRRSKTVPAIATPNTDDVIEVIDLDESNRNNNNNNNNSHKELTTLAQETPKKLAPLFVRAKPCPEMLVARREFLHSGVPDKMRLEQLRQKQYDENCEEAWQLFPSISHVRQCNPKEYARPVMLCKLLGPPLDELDMMVMDGGIFNGIACGARQTVCQRTPSSLTLCRRNVPLAVLPAKRLVVKAWKQQYERFPTYKCYNQLREKYRYFSALDTAHQTQQVSESLMVTHLATRADSATTDDDGQPPAAAPNGELLFTEKYKPMLFEQVLVNLKPVLQLRDFLASWMTARSAAQDPNYSLDESSSSSQQGAVGSFGNTVVLLGPTASGKTNAVYALANELNFNVLEINAGMKRTGKRLIQELKEATQSHQIRRERKQQRGIGQLGEMQSNSSSNLADSPQSARKSLILIEDADIAFDQIDAGFVDAIHTLAAASKRPVIVVASNPNCTHLHRLMLQHTIHFTAPHAVSISRYLAMLSLIENCPINIEDIISLYSFNGMDMRRTLLELQLFVQSGGDLCRRLPSSNGHVHKDSICEPETEEQAIASLYTHQTLFEFYTVDQNVKRTIPYPVDLDLLSANLPELLQQAQALKADAVCDKSKDADNAPKIPISRKSHSPKKAWLTTAGLNAVDGRLDALCAFYEHVSVAAVLDAQNTRRQIESQYNSGLMPNLAADITHTLVQGAVEVNLRAETASYTLFHTPKTR